MNIFQSNDILKTVSMDDRGRHFCTETPVASAVAFASGAAVVAGSYVLGKVVG